MLPELEHLDRLWNRFTVALVFIDIRPWHHIEYLHVMVRHCDSWIFLGDLSVHFAILNVEILSLLDFFCCWIEHCFLG